MTVHLLTKRKRPLRRLDRRRDRRATVDEPVALWTSRADGTCSVFYGWALNISPRGVRVIADATLTLDMPVGVSIGRRDAPRYSGKVVWIDSRFDGCIAGIAFDGSEGPAQDLPRPLQ